MNPRVLLLTCASLISVSVATPCAAQYSARPGASSASEADKKKKEGDEAFKALRYADALRAYEESYTLLQNPALQFNRGRALEALERYADAITAFETFLRDAPPDLRAKAAALPDHVAGLNKKVATIRFVVKPDRARVFVRAVAMGNTPIPGSRRVNAGSARIEVEADGFRPYAREHDLRAGTETTITVSLERSDANAALAKPTPAAAGGDESSGSSPSVFSRWWFWTGAGVVVAGAAVAIVLTTRPSSEPRTGDIGQLNAPLLRF